MAQIQALGKAKSEVMASPECSAQRGCKVQGRGSHASPVEYVRHLSAKTLVARERVSFRSLLPILPAAPRPATADFRVSHLRLVVVDVGNFVWRRVLIVTTSIIHKLSKVVWDSTGSGSVPETRGAELDWKRT